MKIGRTHYLFLVAGIALGIFVSFLWSLRGDPLSCALEKMKGQPSSMQPAVAAYCLKKYGQDQSNT
jgi:hypothetical protein